MAEKVLMNKNALAALKTELREYKNALPVFEMKEQHLKDAVQNIERSISLLRDAIEDTNEEIRRWVAVMAEDTIDLSNVVKVKRLLTEIREIAGVTIETFVDISFENIEVDLFSTSLWVDAAIDAVIDQQTRHLMLEIEKKNIDLLREELSEARRMKNAIKEVFIPETRESIRKIEIYLGDVERLAIGCAKLVKKKKLVKK